MRFNDPEARRLILAIASATLFLAASAIAVAATVKTVKKTDEQLNSIVNETIMEGRGGLND